MYLGIFVKTGFEFWRMQRCLAVFLPANDTMKLIENFEVGAAVVQRSLKFITNQMF